ncbi:MAG: O-antigen ligase family protein [bacterium]
MSQTSNYSIRFNLGLFLVSGILLGFLVTVSPYAAVFATLALFVLFAFAKSPLKALSILILLVPFSAMELFNEAVMNLPGAKPLHLLAFFVLAIAAFHYKQAEPVPGYAKVFILVLVAIFSISVVRSLSHGEIFSYLEEEKLSTSQYLLSYYLKPLIYFMPLLVIIKFAKGKGHLAFVANVMVWSIMVLTAFLLFLYVFKCPNKTDVWAVKDYFSLVLNQHTNDLANFYIVVFPVVLMRFFLKKDLTSIVGLGLTVLGIGILYSRTAYVTMVFTFLMYLVISRRAKILPVFLIVALGLSLVIGASVKKRLTKGFDSKDYNEISAGRIDDIWLPLIEEYSQNPRKLVLGNGRYSIITSEAFREGTILDTVRHPHNMYLELVLDTGILGLLIVVICSGVVVRKVLKGLRVVRNDEIREYLYAVLVSMTSYFVAGLSGRSVYPDVSNSFFWIVVGMAVATLRLLPNSGESTLEET